MRVGELLDESLVVDESVSAQGQRCEFRITQSGKTWDLSKIDFEKLKEEFQAGEYKNIEIADLRAFIQHKLDQMLKQNATRRISRSGCKASLMPTTPAVHRPTIYFEELVKFTKDLKAESERHIREGLTEDELELFDLLKKDKMTKEETQKVRLAAKSLSIVYAKSRRRFWSGLVQGLAK